LNDCTNEEHQSTTHDAVFTTEAGCERVEGHAGDEGAELLETDGEGVDFGLLLGRVVEVGHEGLEGEDTAGDTWGRMLVLSIRVYV